MNVWIKLCLESDYLWDFHSGATVNLLYCQSKAELDFHSELDLSQVGPACSFFDENLGVPELKVWELS